MSDETELRELRKRLQGALADLETERGTVIDLRTALRDAEQKLEAQGAQYKRLLDEKERFWNFDAKLAEADPRNQRPSEDPTA